VSFVRYDRSLDTSARTGGGKPAISSYAAFVLRAGTEPVVVPLGPADRIDTDIGEWRNRAAAQPDARRPDLERETRRVGDKLRRRLWDPLEPHVRGAERILVVPDGALHLINLAALPVGESAYLIEGVPLIHYLTAERDIPHFAKGAPTTGRGLLALGGASFDAASAAAPPRPASVAPTDAGRATRSACGSLRSMQFSALPGTLGEVQDVARLWNQADQSASRSSHILTGTSASERAFKKDGPGKRVLHLATHGFFLGSQCSGRSETRAAGVLAHTSTVDRSSVDSESPLLQTGLALASANLRARATADDEDGILTGEEVAALNLEGTEWAVLSACDTGLGEVRNGEGVFGLRRAFQIAGVRSVIMSLWPVDDRVTRDWMVALYRARLERKLDTAESVRAASLEILRNRRAGRLSTNPLYWAGFVAAGDWK